jgi:hypothetical protein
MEKKVKLLSLSVRSGIRHYPNGRTNNDNRFGILSVRKINMLGEIYKKHHCHAELVSAPHFKRKRNTYLLQAKRKPSKREYLMRCRNKFGMTGFSISFEHSSFLEFERAQIPFASPNH